MLSSSVTRGKKFMLSFKRMPYQLFQLKVFFLQLAFDLSFMMVDVKLLSVALFISVLPTQSSTYLPAYLGHSFICDISNSASLTVDCTFNNDVQRIARSMGTVMAFGTKLASCRLL